MLLRLSQILLPDQVRFFRRKAVFPAGKFVILQEKKKYYFINILCSKKYEFHHILKI